ncbi:hypothetical protein Xmau_03741 [Xenorhabdus mauleonii]|uniref:Uncharacterized protein n=1 Tax=Xenorhabdus mauleonii TaxID=351675 RepID=A0A1I3XYB3_9GAMM|nr:hypothetical protein [Xenorhabdus mauleonii]PHM37779.1 hypothetical protein Xmau_03741 [Xenorhabdus mauleonii]SFK24493.1 hypothetical protein SAMN05421680_14016 [Xenorhabdus mauleonii]
MYKPLLKITALLSFFILSFSAIAASNTVTVFQCANKNHKMVNVSLSGGIYIYRFGKTNQQPDIELQRSPEQLSHRFNNISAAETDTGKAQIRELNFKNGDFIYSVTSSELGTKYVASVDVYKKDKLLTSIKCQPDTIVDHLSDYIFDLPEVDS